MSTKKTSNSFRDSLATMTADGKRSWIYPKKPRGKFTNYRTWVSYFLLIVLFGLPFIKVNDLPIFLFDILNRKFILFGIIFWPQDFYLFVLFFLIGVVGIAVFTSIFGRVWCGWTCPQTIFMEMVFRKIEYAIEGDYQAQRRLDKAPWNAEKIAKKSFKHVVFYMLSFLIANTFLAYIIGLDSVVQIIQEPITEHLGGFVSIHIFTLLFYGVFAKFREQACTLVCPYGRFQSVLVNNDTIAVTYDYERGEPRGHLQKNQTDTNQGDCIDCNLCVQVCPTGIDIRNGIQMECVNCTACMDACDEVMVKIQKPTGLIRYASNNSIKNKVAFKMSPRQYAYVGVLMLLLVGASLPITSRNDFDATVLRQAGTLYQKIDETHVSNMYVASIFNKSYSDIQCTIKSSLGELRFITQDLTVAKDSEAELRFFLILSTTELISEKTPIEFQLFADGKHLKTIKSFFISSVDLEKK
jgi:cytochrome c oxidase accessory protein FixG